MSDAYQKLCLLTQSIDGKRDADSKTCRYYIFTEADRARSPQETLDLIDTELSECDKKARDVCNEGARQVAVTEWSCASPFPQPLEWMQQFGQRQCRQWRARSSGSFFWTLRREDSEVSYIFPIIF